MIDLKEIGIDNLIEIAEGSEFGNSNSALSYLSLPDLLDKIYDGFRVTLESYGICGTYCNSGPTSLYSATDEFTEWTSDRPLCKEHMCRAVYNGMEQRVRRTYDSSDGWNAVMIETMLLHESSQRKLLVPTDNWPELEPESRCTVCNDGIINTDIGYKSETAYDYEGNEIIVHNNCMWHCQNCNKPYAVQRYRYRNGVARLFVTIVSDGRRNSQAWCQSCWDASADNEDTTNDICNRCGTLLLSRTGDDLTTYSELTDEEVCYSCYENGIDCDDCGYTMYEGEYHECRWDDDSDDDEGIHNYSYKPRPLFHGTAGPYMGFELEVEAKSGDRDSGVRIFDRIDCSEQHYYLKTDGSLSYGFEIVTHPHNLSEYHKLDWSWLDELTNLGFRSWNTSSCGLHVHIGLDAFDNEAHEIRFTKFIYDNERQAKRIAGRSSNYAAFDSKGKVIPKIKYKYRDGNRYTAVNVQNEKTLEVRIFRGSLRKERVLSAIEFTHAVCEYTRNMKIVPKAKPFSWLRFSAFVAANDEQYPNLFTIINETFERAREIDNQEDGDDD